MSKNIAKQGKRWNLGFLILLFLTIAIFPKFTIISIPESHAGIRIEDILILIYTIFLFVGILKSGFSRYKKLFPILKIFGVVFVSFMISNILGAIAGNVSWTMSMLYLVRVFEYFILIFVGCDLIRLSSDERLIVKLVKFTLIFHGIFMVFEALGIIPDIGILINRVANNRIYTTFSGPYEFAGYLSICMPLILGEIFQKKRYTSIVYLLIIVAGVLLSESRIALVAIVVVFLWCSIKYMVGKDGKEEYKKHRMVSSKILVPIILAVMAGIFFIPRFVDRFSLVSVNEYTNAVQYAWEDGDFEVYKNNDKVISYGRAIFATQDASFGMRITKWMLLLKETLRASPLFGLGMSVSGEAMDGSIMKLLCETGIIGLVVWILLIIAVYKAMPKIWHVRTAALMVIVALFVNAMFIDIFDASKVMTIFWLLMGYYIFIDEKISQKKTKVVHVVDGINYGGVESVLSDYYEYSNNELFDLSIISHTAIPRAERDKFEALGFKVYQVKPKRENILKNFIEICAVVKRERPDVLHVHMGFSSYLALFAGWIYFVPIRICHIHVVALETTIKMRFERVICNIFCNGRMACSRLAAEKIFKYKKDVVILKNVFDVKEFKFNGSERRRIRRELGIAESETLIGNVGRFSVEKNQTRAVEIFSGLGNDYKMILIGDGRMRSIIERMIKESGLVDRVILLGNRSDVAKYYSAMDIFLSTSFSEGFGMAILEAQANGLPCVVSGNIADDVICSDNFVRLDLNEADDVWANRIRWNNKRAEQLSKKIMGFDAKENKDKLNNIYLRMINHLGNLTYTGNNK